MFMWSFGPLCNSLRAEAQLLHGLPRDLRRPPHGGGRAEGGGRRPAPSLYVIVIAIVIVRLSLGPLRVVKSLIHGRFRRPTGPAWTLGGLSNYFYLDNRSCTWGNPTKAN